MLISSGVSSTYRSRTAPVSATVSFSILGGGISRDVIVPLRSCTLHRSQAALMILSNHTACQLWDKRSTWEIDSRLFQQGPSLVTVKLRECSLTTSQSPYTLRCTWWGAPSQTPRSPRRPWTRWRAAWARRWRGSGDTWRSRRCSPAQCEMRWGYCRHGAGHLLAARPRAVALPVAETVVRHLNTSWVISCHER